MEFNLFFSSTFLDMSSHFSRSREMGASLDASLIPVSISLIPFYLYFSHPLDHGKTVVCPLIIENEAPTPISPELASLYCWSLIYRYLLMVGFSATTSVLLHLLLPQGSCHFQHNMIHLWRTSMFVPVILCSLLIREMRSFIDIEL